MIKKLVREVIEMILVFLTMLLIVSVIRYIGAGGSEMVIARAIIVTMICIVIGCIFSLISEKRA